MKKHSKKPLVLSSETVRTLDHELAHVGGAAPRLTLNTCVVTFAHTCTTTRVIQCGGQTGA